MLDGMDGLAGAMSLVALVAFGWIGRENGSVGVVAISVLMFGVVLGFLIFNLPMTFNRDIRCFMGDSGSTLLGFMLAYQGISISQGPAAEVSPVTVLWLAAMPIYELLWTIIRRISRGRSPFSADREHMHHLLQDAGFGVRAAFVVLVSFGIAFASCGVVMHFLGVPDWLSFVLFVACGAVTIRLMYQAPAWLSRLPEGWQRLASKPFQDSGAH
jgi:UDP-GlcNAc:undecaprenyl-phosphate GlcNAc-1-phosphate transferase